jgi:putative IMPACT (imprinted ancient) family translation regulator
MELGEDWIMSDTSRYTVTDHPTGGYGNTYSYSVRLPDVQQVPGAATRYYEDTAGRRRTWRSRAAAQRMADALNVVLDRTMAKQQETPADAPTLAQKVTASVDQRSRQYEGKITRQDGTDMDVEFPSMISAADFVANYRLSSLACVRSTDGMFNTPVVLTFDLDSYARSAGIEV